MKIVTMTKYITAVFIAFMGSSHATTCDVDADSDIDRIDISLIFSARGQPATGVDDPRDSDGNGVISIADGRRCAAVCTLPRCAEPEPEPLPPPAPTNLVAIGKEMSAFVSWTEEPSATAYNLYWHKSATVSPTTYLGAKSVDTNSDEVTGLVNGVEYFFVVTSVEDGLESEASAVATATPSAPSTLSDKHFFAVTQDYFQWQPWVTDGTVDGTMQLSTVAGGWNDMGFTHFNDAVYFVARHPSINGYGDFWKTDGTPANTQQVTNLLSQNIRMPSPPFCVAGDYLMLHALNEDSGFSFAHRLTTDDTIEEMSINDVVNCRNSTHVGAKLYYAAWSNTALNTVMFESDGVTINEVVNDGNYIKTPDRITNVAGNLFYFVRTSSSHTTLWRADGDGSNPMPLAQFLHLNTSFIEETDEQGQMTVLDGKLYFNANDGVHGHTLWVSDGTVLGTYMVKDLDDSPANTEVTQLKVLGDKLLFSADGDAAGLWVSDGSSAGTVKISDYRPLEQLYHTHVPSNAVVANGLYFFAAENGLGQELWASDGTAAGTYLVKDINTSGHSAPVYLVSREGYILFAALESEIMAHELWRSDGTVNGTILLKDTCTDDYCSGLVPLAF